MTPPCAAPAEELPKTSFSGALRLMRLKKGDVTRGEPKVRQGIIFVLCVPNQDICSPKIKAFIVASLLFLYDVSVPVFKPCAGLTPSILVRKNQWQHQLPVKLRVFESLLN